MTEPRIPPTAEFSEGSGGGKFDLMQALKLFRGGEVIKQDLEEEFRQTFFSANAKMLRNTSKEFFD